MENFKRSVKFKMETWMEIPIPDDMDEQQMIDYLSGNPNRRQLADYLTSIYTTMGGTTYPMNVLSMLELKPTIEEATVIFGDEDKILWRNNQ